MAFKKLMISTAMSGAIFFSGSVFAESVMLKAQTFETQFDKTVALNEQTSWLFFSTTKEGGNWVKETFTQLAWNEEVLSSKKILYVADIHRMPSFITKIIAIPNMRDYAFPIALDKEGDSTQAWPVQENAVNVYQLKQLEVVKTHHFENQADLEAFVKGL